ncbi:hypothetical protein [Stutzerimonas xanthomarina]|uniref:hypothetical protein n=1 Tax=Stutzerimonas xanthomarina TaxID=271420 RepID=UPI003AA89282
MSLPAGVIRWRRWYLHPDWSVSRASRAPGLAAVRTLTSLSFSDDEMCRRATPIPGFYSSARKPYAHAPAEIGATRIGRFGFRRSFADNLWTPSVARAGARSTPNGVTRNR